MKKRAYMTTILSTTKTQEEYGNSKLFLCGEPGLVDTIHLTYPKIWGLYKEMKSLDWSEDEFNYSKCFGDFKTVDKDISDMMLETIMTQWEADSIASRFPLVLISPFQPCTEIVEAEQAIQTNELVHSNTYSEIIRMSFDNPREVLAEMLAKTETFDRISLVNKTLQEFKDFSAYCNYYGIKDSDEYVYAQLIKFYFTLLLLERIQFMASFAITFTICKSGPFQPIGMAVKKIAQDELEVHSEYRKQVLSELIKIDKNEFNGKIMESVKPELIKLFDEVIESELLWTDRLFEGRTLVGTNKEVIKQWVLFNAKDVSRFIGFTKEEVSYVYPKQNPMPFLEDWFNMNNTQAAPQEQDVAAYKVKVVSRDDESITFDF